MVRSLTCRSVPYVVFMEAIDLVLDPLTTQQVLDRPGSLPRLRARLLPQRSADLRPHECAPASPTRLQVADPCEPLPQMPVRQQETSVAPERCLLLSAAFPESPTWP